MTLDACADLVARGDPDRFRTVMAAPIDARKKLLPIYAFNVEVTRAPWLTDEAMIAEMRLQWWRDALEEIREEKAIRSHEVTRPLATVIDPESARILDTLVDARRWDIGTDPFESRADFDGYIDATASGLMWVGARTLGARPEDENRYRDIGWAAGLAALFRAIPELEARGRKPLVDGRPEAVAELAGEGLERLSRGRAAGVSGPATWPAVLAGPILRQAKADPRRVADGRLGTSEFTHRARLLRAGFSGRIPR